MASIISRLGPNFLDVLKRKQDEGAALKRPDTASDEASVLSSSILKRLGGSEALNPPASSDAPIIKKLNEFAGPSMRALAGQDSMAGLMPSQPSASPGLQASTGRISPPLDRPSASNEFSAPGLMEMLKSSDVLKPIQEPTAPAMFTTSLRSPMPQQASGAQTDVSTLPVADRRSAILDQEAQQTSPPTPQAPDSRPSAADARRAQLEDRFAKLLELEGQDVRDQNGRLKSGLLSSLRGLLQNGILGAVSEGIYGAWHPEYDEQVKQSAKILKERGKLDEAMRIENEFARLDALNARTDATAQKNSPDAQNAKTRKDLMSELAQRMRLAGGKLDLQDARAVELGQQLGIRGKQGGGGFNPQRVRTIRGGDGQDRLVYVDGPEDYHYIGGDGSVGTSLSERDKKFLAIELERENRQRALDGLPPLTFADTPTASPAVSTPVSTRPNAPVLIPSGEKPLPVQPIFRRGGHRGGYSRSGASSGGSQRDQGFAESGAADARARAAEARGRGQDDVAAAWEQKAEIEDRRLQRAGGSPRVSARGLGAQSVSGGLSAAGGSQGGRVSRSNFVKNNPQYRSKSRREIDAAIKADGYTPY